MENTLKYIDSCRFLSNKFVSSRQTTYVDKKTQKGIKVLSIFSVILTLLSSLLWFMHSAVSDLTTHQRPSCSISPVSVRWFVWITIIAIYNHLYIDLLSLYMIYLDLNLLTTWLQPFMSSEYLYKSYELIIFTPDEGCTNCTKMITKPSLPWVVRA